MKHILLLSLLLVACHARGAAQVDWFTLDGGGGVQVSANYTANFTVGQNDVASTAAISARYKIVPGFWALETFGPDPGRPKLTITLAGANVLLTWPSASPGFILEQTDNIAPVPASWSNTAGAISDNGIIKSITISHNVARRFYRLKKN